METYSFKVSGVYKGFTADDAVEELNRIRNIYGELTPENVVEASKVKSSLLHDVFEWNDTAAAEKYRIRQAQELIRSIRVTIVHENVEVSLRAFVHVQPDKSKPHKIIPLTEAILDENAYADLLQQAKKDMMNFVSIYSQLQELNEVKAAMLKAINEI